MCRVKWGVRGFPNFFSDIIYKTCNISVRFHSRNTIFDIFDIYTSLGVRRSTKTFLKTCLKLRNKLKSKCVQFFETPCTNEKMTKNASKTDFKGFSVYFLFCSYFECTNGLT